MRKSLLCARDCVLIFVKQFLYPKCHFNVAFSVDALTGTILLRCKHRKLRFPVTEHVSLNPGEFTYLTDLEEQLLGYGYGRTGHRLKPRQDPVPNLIGILRQTGEGNNTGLMMRHVTRVNFSVSILTLRGFQLKLFLKSIP